MHVSECGYYLYLNLFEPLDTRQKTRSALEMGYEKGTTAKRQTVSLIIEGEKLCAYREELMTVSPVFRKMLSSQFKETYSGEIEFPGKNMLQFKCFMECLQRGPSSNVTGNLNLYNVRSSNVTGNLNLYHVR